MDGNTSLFGEKMIITIREKYSVPTSGYYTITGEDTWYKDTGLTSAVKNHNKWWWQWWKPSTIEQPVYVQIKKRYSNGVVRLNAGDTITWMDDDIR